MIKKWNISIFIAFFLAFILKRITYVIGGFSFANAPLISLYSLYDCLILIVYGIIIENIITKVMSKKGKNKGE